MDFTIKKYINLLEALKGSVYSFQTFAEYSKRPNDHALMLRHDVDALPKNSLHFAKIQAERGVKGTYYFRIVSQSFDENIIREIASLGHEIGYHYETMDSCRGNVDEAYDEFCRNLEKFKNIADIKTISMHGSPLSKFDNRDIWKKYDYKKLGIIAEPYFDLNFNDIYYITDTGRRWDGHLYNLRDKATADNPISNADFLKLRFRTSQDIINAINSNKYPQQAMLNFHPQRWHDKTLPWTKELLWQNVKNQGKRVLNNVRKS